MFGILFVKFPYYKNLLHNYSHVQIKKKNKLLVFENINLKYLQGYKSFVFPFLKVMTPTWVFEYHIYLQKKWVTFYITGRKYHHNNGLRRMVSAQRNRISVRFFFLQWDLLCRICFDHSYRSFRFEPIIRLS